MTLLLTVALLRDAFICAITGRYHGDDSAVKDPPSHVLSLLRTAGSSSGWALSHCAVRGWSSAIADQLSPGASTWMISGVAEMTSGIQAMAALKWSEFTCASPAARSLKASISTNWLGLSTLFDHSKKTLPGSSRVAEVKGATRDSHCSATSGRTENLTTIKIIVAPWTSIGASSVTSSCMQLSHAGIAWSQCLLRMLSPLDDFSSRRSCKDSTYWHYTCYFVMPDQPASTPIAFRRKNRSLPSGNGERY